MREIESEGYDRQPEVLQAGERAGEEALVTAMYREVVKDVDVDEEKLREFYDEHREELWSDPGVELAVITTETQEEAESIYEELQAGGDFAELAKERSFDEVSGAQGGKLRGALYTRQLEAFPDIVDVVGNTAEGQYARPLPMPAGFMAGEYAIIKVIKKIESVPLEFNEIKQMLGQRVVQLEQDQAFGEWLTGKMEEYGVEIYPEPLAQIDFASLRE